MYILLAKSQQHFVKANHKPKLMKKNITKFISFLKVKGKRVDGIGMNGIEHFRGKVWFRLVCMVNLLLCFLRKEIWRHFINSLISLFFSIGTYFNSHINNKNTKTVWELKKLLVRNQMIDCRAWWFQKKPSSAFFLLLLVLQLWGPLHLYVCEMQLWLLQWKNTLKISFCSRKKKTTNLPNGVGWGPWGKFNIYLVIENTYWSLDLHS